MVNLKCMKAINILKDNKCKLVISAVILSCALVLGGCTSESKTNEVDNTPPAEIPAQTNDVETAENVSEFTEEDVVNYFHDIETLVSTMLESDSAQNVKEEVIDIFITCVEFVFYNGEIKGYTFAELSTEAKEKIIDSVMAIDEYIEAYYPGYKEEISEEYNMGKEWLSEKMNLLATITEEELGEEAWDSLLETKIQITEAGASILDSASKIYEIGKQNTNEWYNIFREEHQ